MFDRLGRQWHRTGPGGRRGRRRDLEEALHLGSVEVEGDDTVDTGCLDRIGAHAGPDRDPGLVLLVALGVAEVGHDRSDRSGAGPFEGVDPKEELHEVVIGGKACSLHKEDVASPDVLQHSDEEVSLREPQGLARPERAVEVVGDGAAEFGAG